MKYLRITRVLVLTLLVGGLLTVAGCDLIDKIIDKDDDGNGFNMQEGAVFSMSNARSGNTVVAYSRAEDGMLTRVGSFDTGGTGSGSFEDTAHGLVLGSAEGESSPNNLLDDADLLFATNAGSNSITVFSVEEDGLEQVEIQDSGGEKPVSITVNNGLVYVLHSGETNDDLFDAEGNVIAPNCTTGNLPSITGFTVTSDGQLDPISGSTRQLSGDAFSGCAQVSFNPSGNVLVVTERTAVKPGKENNQTPEGDEGLILTYNVNNDGTLGNQRIIDATGQGPFGFTFRKDGLLLTTEQFDGPMGPMLGAAAAYTINSDGTLNATSESVDNGGTDTCWFVVNDDGDLGFASSFFDPTPRISTYSISDSGNLQVLQADAAVTEQGTSDLALSSDSNYLYNINSFNGTIQVFAVSDDGSLNSIQMVQAHDPSDMAGVLGIAAF